MVSIILLLSCDFWTVKVRKFPAICVIRTERINEEEKEKNSFSAAQVFCWISDVEVNTFLCSRFY